MKEFAHPDREETGAGRSQPGDRRARSRSRATSSSTSPTSRPTSATLPPVRLPPRRRQPGVPEPVVNAAHAIGDVVKATGRQGAHRRAHARATGDCVVVIASPTPAAASRRRSAAAIFDPFFTTKEVGRGTGQGLAIARSVVVDKHGGTLTFETEIGRGTTFHVRLPIDGRPRAGVRAGPAETCRHERGGPPGPASGDRPASCSSTTSRTSSTASAACSARSATSGTCTSPGAAARRSTCSRRSPFDVLVTDMRMPGMDGGELLAEVMRRHPARRAHRAVGPRRAGTRPSARSARRTSS